MTKEQTEVDHLLKVIGYNLKTYRTQAGLTQQDLAERSGVSRPNISNIEKAVTSPSVATLVYLSAALGISVRDFFESQVKDRA